MKKTTVIILAFVAVFLTVSNSVAQCNPARIGGCPTNNVGAVMFGNLAYTGAGYGYGGYGYGRRGNGAWRAVSTGLNVVGDVLIAREQTRQVRAIVGANQREVVYVQQQPQLQSSDVTPTKYGLSSIKPLFPEDSVSPSYTVLPEQREPLFRITNRSGFRARITFNGGYTIYLEQGRFKKLTQAEIEAIDEVTIFLTIENGIDEVVASLVPTRDLNNFDLVAQD